MQKTAIFFLLCLLLAFSAPGFAGERDSHLYKNNALGFKAGAHFWEGSDFLDYWDIDESDLTGFAGELAYERKLSKNTGIEFSFGYTWSDKSYDIQIFGIPALSEVEMSTFYIAPSIKFYAPAGNTVVFYLGVGPDFYFSDGDWTLKNTTLGSLRYDDHDINYGAHGLVGIEFYIYKHPKRHGWYDAPISVFFEYKYTWVEWDDADKEVLDWANTNSGLAETYHDLDLGGHSAFAGLRWHF